MALRRCAGMLPRPTHFSTAARVGNNVADHRVLGNPGAKRTPFVRGQEGLSVCAVNRGFDHGVHALYSTALTDENKGGQPLRFPHELSLKFSRLSNKVLV